MTTIIDLALKTMCPRCEARPNVWCVTVPAGEPASSLHGARVNPIREAYVLGFEEREAVARRIKATVPENPSHA